MRLSLIALACFLVSACSTDMITGADQKAAEFATAESPMTVAASTSASEPSSMAYYDVTITNLTHSQPFSPGVIVSHAPSVALFSVGDAASAGIQAIAENGDPSVAALALDGVDGVSDVVATDAPVHRKGGPGANRVTWRIAAADGDVLSLGVMLICTNDGFAGLNRVALPKGPETAVHFAKAYDAGTELNDELLTSIVDACGAIGPVSLPGDGANNRTGTEDAVQMHSNIDGSGDLETKTYGWTRQIAQVKIKRVG